MFGLRIEYIYLKFGLFSSSSSSKFSYCSITTWGSDAVCNDSYIVGHRALVTTCPTVGVVRVVLKTKMSQLNVVIYVGALPKRLSGKTTRDFSCVSIWTW